MQDHPGYSGPSGCGTWAGRNAACSSRTCGTASRETNQRRTGKTENENKFLCEPNCETGKTDLELPEP